MIGEEMIVCGLTFRKLIFLIKLIFFDKKNLLLLALATSSSDWQGKTMMIIQCEKKGTNTPQYWLLSREFDSFYFDNRVQ